MRCACCNTLLTISESTLKDPDTNEFLNTCTDCLAEIDTAELGKEYTDMLYFDDNIGDIGDVLSSLGLDKNHKM